MASTDTVTAPCDCRLGQEWTLAQRAKNAVILWTVRVTLWLADRLPPGLLMRIGRHLGAASRLVLARKRSAAERGLAMVMGDPDPVRRARDCFVCAGENLATTLLLRRPSVRALDWVLVPHPVRLLLEETLSLGRGAVFVSAHLGPFELVAAVVSEFGFRPAVVVRESYDPRLDPLVDTHRVLRGIEVIHRGRPGAGNRILRALRKGHPVGFLPDLGGRVQRSPVMFLGRRLPMPVGPQRIALRAGCPLLVGTLQPLTGVSARPDDKPRFVLGLVRLEASDESTLAQLVADELTSAIRSARHHWLWMAAGFPWTERR
ncbi:lysophospholipid acyltransferase family protein [Myxococcota bacterium]